jgi:hypothetical protein
MHGKFHTTWFYKSYDEANIAKIFVEYFKIFVTLNDISSCFFFFLNSGRQQKYS